MLTEVESRTLQRTRGESSRRARFMSALEVWRLIHWRSLLTQWRISLLVLVGVALGITLFAGMVVMVWATGRPLASQDDLLASAADYQVSPLIARGLPEDLFREIDAEPSVTSAIPLIGGLTQLASIDSSQGVVLFGADCRIEKMIGSFDCEARLARIRQPTPATHGLVLSRPTADSIGVQVGDAVGVSGGFIGDATVVEIVGDETPVTDLNNGFWAIGSIPAVQDLLHMGPHLTQVLVNTDDGGAAGIAQRLEGLAVVEGPQNEQGKFIELTRQILLVAAIVVLIGGLLIAGNTYALAIEARRRDLAVTSVIGQSPRRLFAGLAAEGAAMGVVAGLIATAPAWLIGAWLTQTWGGDLLAGSGATIDVPISVWWLPILCAATGALTGASAAAPSAFRFVRSNHSGVLRGEIATASTRGVSPAWVMLGLGLLATGLAIGFLWGASYVPFAIGIIGAALLAAGLVVTFFSVAPLAIRRVELLCSRGRASSLLTAADLANDPVRWSTVVVVVSMALAIGIGFNSVRSMSVESLTDHVKNEVDERVFAHPHKMGDQGIARFGPAAIRAIEETDGVSAVDVEFLSVISTDRGPVNLLGTNPESPRSNLAFETGVDTQSIWRRVDAGEVVISKHVSRTWGLGAGDEIGLPTVYGARSFQIAAVADAGFSKDNGIGPWIVSSNTAAQDLWAAAPDSVFVSPADGTRASALAQRLETELGVVGLTALDAMRIPAQTEANGSRFLGPLERVGWLMVFVGALAVAIFLVLGLSQRERQRTVLRWIGYNKRLERKNLLIEVGALAALGLLFGIGGAWLLALFVSLASPSLLASSVGWQIVPLAIVRGAIAAAAIGVIALAVTWWQAGKLDRRLAERALGYGAQQRPRRYRRKH